MSPTRHTFTDEQWDCIEPLLPPRKGHPGGSQRTFFNALLWMACTGSPWRDLPEVLGHWNVVYQRYAYWCIKGHFQRLFEALQRPDLQEVMLDSTCCRAHQASSGAGKKHGPQAIGVTRGGLNTKIHAVCDALGNPLRFLLTVGQRHDSQPAPELIKGLQAKALIADKAYDSKKLVKLAQAQGMQVIIPSRAKSKEPRPLDKQRYEARHLIENLFQRMKVFRRVATRFDKLDTRFLGFVHLAGIMKWLH
jgi:transposase